MIVKISPHKLSGTVTAPVSKSEAHRMLICAALSDAPVKLFMGKNTKELPNDVAATVKCLRALGAEISFTDGNFLNVTPVDFKNIPQEIELDCQESGSTLRFILPVASALCEHVRLKGCGRLPERPVSELINAMKNHGVNFSSMHLPFETSGKLQSGVYELPGNISSQYVSGLMLALPLLKSDSEIKLTSELKSSAYVGITLSVLKKFGLEINQQNNIYKISGGKKFVSPGSLSIGGDWSGAAFFFAIGALSDSVSVAGLSVNSPQGDKKILDILADMGADVKTEDGIITVSPFQKNKKFKQIEIDIDSTPDLFPILAAAASCSGCGIIFHNASRLRLKESDRIASVAAMINSLGGKFEFDEKSGAVSVGGNCNLKGGSVNGCNDHRIVMAAAVAACKCAREVTITDAECVKKSYPEFFSDYSSLGGIVNVI